MKGNKKGRKKSVVFSEFDQVLTFEKEFPIMGTFHTPRKTKLMKSLLK
jgi:hypothetical protein